MARMSFGKRVPASARPRRAEPPGKGRRGRCPGDEEGMQKQSGRLPGAFPGHPRPDLRALRREFDAANRHLLTVHHKDGTTTTTPDAATGKTSASTA